MCFVDHPMRVLLPTIDAPPVRGGVARYIGAIASTWTNVRVALVDSEFAVVRLLWREWGNYDAVWVHHVLPIGTVAWRWRLLGGKPYVIFLHGLDFDLARRNVWKRWLTRRILRGAQYVVANSRALADEVAAFAKIAVPMVVYPCVSDEIVEAAREDFRRETLDVRGLRLLTVGRLVERKGHMKVLEAMREMPDVQYTIVGDGPMREVIKEKIRELGLTDRVIVRTDVTDEELPDVYRGADVFVMPSTKSLNDREGFGIVYIEAALFGVPSIAVRQPGVDEAIVDGVTGVLIDDNIAALHDAIGRIMSDRSFCVRLGEQARERVLKEFTREAQFSKLRGIL